MSFERGYQNSLVVLKYRQQIREGLDVLTEKERKVVTLRHGLEDGRSRTLEEVGKELGVMRERIRQIEAKALRKIKDVK